LNLQTSLTASAIEHYVKSGQSQILGFSKFENKFFVPNAPDIPLHRASQDDSLSSLQPR
jgi:hypothetical protein